MRAAAHGAEAQLLRLQAERAQAEAAALRDELAARLPALPGETTAVVIAHSLAEAQLLQLKAEHVRLKLRCGMSWRCR
jgi:hypothetical protein